MFYFEKESKRSEWSVPEEIRAEVEELEKEEKRVRDEKAKEEEEKRKEERLERLREQERVRVEVEEERRKKGEKRKAGAEGGSEGKEAKKVKVEDGTEEVEEELAGPKDEEDEEAWMKAVAAEFAAADKSAADQEKQDKEDTAKAEEEAAKKVFAVPDKVVVSPEEGRALFKVSYRPRTHGDRADSQALLMEKKISPFSTWEQSLPLFINDPRYVLLSSPKIREEVYDEYCREAGRQRRLNKAGPAASAAAAETKKADPEREYKALLREEVTSTRTRWDDWRKKWKKDRRLYSFGRDDREREKVFKQHLKELGEREFQLPDTVRCQVFGIAADKGRQESRRPTSRSGLFRPLARIPQHHLYLRLVRSQTPTLLGCTIRRGRFLFTPGRTVSDVYRQDCIEQHGRDARAGC